jgi:hypothetical protein
MRMLGKSRWIGKWKRTKRWQDACNQSNVRVTCSSCIEEREVYARVGLLESLVAKVREVLDSPAGVPQTERGN